jgi:drug/metabolite transporter (DMT)-like permease
MKITLKAAIAISLIHALWGVNPVAVKFGLEVFPPLWSGFLRFTIAIVCILIWAWIKGIPMMLKREELVPFSMLGLLFFIQIWLMNEGFSLSSGTMSSVLISTFPLFAAFFSHYMIKGDQLTFLRVLGLAVAFLGTSVIVLRRGGLDVEEFSIWGATIVLLSATLLGFRLILSAKMVRQTEPTRKPSNVALSRTIVAPQIENSSTSSPPLRKTITLVPKNATASPKTRRKVNWSPLIM